MQDHGNHIKLIIAVAAGFAILAALGVPIVSYLPLLAILAICPLMMIFMMRGMDHSGGGNRRDDDPHAAHRH